MTKAYDKLASLVPRLQAITLANGYLTDAGVSVLIGPVPKQPDEALPFIRLIELDAVPESAPVGRPAAKVRIQFVAEGYIEESTAASIMATGHKLVADIKRAMFGDPARDLNGQAIDARLEGYSIQPPESGSDIVLAQVRGSFSFHDDFTSP